MGIRSFSVAIVGAGMLLAAAPASAQPAPSGAPAATLQRDLDTNMALLKGLVERRAVIERGNSHTRSEALAFVDRQIAIVQNDVRNARARMDR